MTVALRKDTRGSKVNMPMGTGQGQPGQVMYPGQVMMQQGPSGMPGYSQPQYAQAYGQPVPPPLQQSESEKLHLQARLDVVLLVA